jgi:hypothetical protein
MIAYNYRLNNLYGSYGETLVESTLSHYTLTGPYRGSIIITDGSTHDFDLRAEQDSKYLLLDTKTKTHCEGYTGNDTKYIKSYASIYKAHLHDPNFLDFRLYFVDYSWKSIYFVSFRELEKKGIGNLTNNDMIYVANDIMFFGRPLWHHARQLETDEIERLCELKRRE